MEKNYIRNILSAKNILLVEFCLCFIKIVFKIYVSQKYFFSYSVVVMCVVCLLHQHQPIREQEPPLSQ